MSRLRDRVRELDGIAQMKLLSSEHNAVDARAALAAAFGPTALAAVEALEADGHKWLWRLGVSAVLHASDCGGCAVIRSWEQALEIGEEQSDGA